MSLMDSENAVRDGFASMEEIVLELEWMVHEGARKRLSGQSADEELAAIDRLSEIQMSFVVEGKERDKQSAQAA